MARRRSPHMNITPDRRSLQRLAALMASTYCVVVTSRAQDSATPKMPEQHQHAQNAGQASELEFPKLGRAQAKAKEPLFTLERALETARVNNPTIRQAEAGIRAVKSRAQQAGLYPNPTVGYSGDEIRGGEIHGGKQGFFVQQTIVTAGKLSLARDVLSKDAKLAEIESEEQKTRVETAVKVGFYRGLAAQELADSRADVARSGTQTVET